MGVSAALAISADDADCRTVRHLDVWVEGDYWEYGVVDDKVGMLTIERRPENRGALCTKPVAEAKISEAAPWRLSALG